MGFTKFQDDVFDAFLAADVSKRAGKVFLYVYRKTVGWGVDAVAVKPAEAAEATGLPRQVITQTLNELVTLGMLVTSQAGVSVQHDVTKWAEVSQNVTAGVTKRDSTVSQNVTASVTKRDSRCHVSYHPTHPRTSNGAAFEVPKDSTDNTDNPLTPKGEPLEVPFEVGPYPLRPEEGDLDLEAVFPEAAAEGVTKQVSRAAGLSPAPKPKKIRRAAAYSPAFEAFWGAYPGGGAKIKAWDQWLSADLEADGDKLAAVLAAVDAQVADRRRTPPGGFYPEWPDAERWISHSRWTDKLRFPAASSIVPIATAASSSREAFLAWARGLTSTIGRADDKVRCLVERAAVVDGVAVDLNAAHRVLEEQGLDEAWVWVHRAIQAGKSQRREVANG